MLIHLEPSDEFLTQRALLTQQLREEARPIFDAMGIALDQLKDTGWGPELNISQIDDNCFAYPFHESYQLTFKVKGQLPAEGPTEEMWLYLLTIERLTPKTGSTGPEKTHP